MNTQKIKNKFESMTTLTVMIIVFMVALIWYTLWDREAIDQVVEQKK